MPSIYDDILIQEAVEGMMNRLLPAQDSMRDMLQVVLRGASPNFMREALRIVHATMSRLTPIMREIRPSTTRQFQDEDHMEDRVLVAQAGVQEALRDAFANHSGSPALQQMSHLAVYLQDCDDEARKAEMIQVGGCRLNCGR